MRHITLTILNQNITGYELDEGVWYVDLHDISDWLDLDYEILDLQQVTTPLLCRYLVPVEGLGRALLQELLHRPTKDTQGLVMYLLSTDLSTLFCIAAVSQGLDVIDYLEHCFSL